MGIDVPEPDEMEEMLVEFSGGAAEVEFEQFCNIVAWQRVYCPRLRDDRRVYCPRLRDDRRVYCPRLRDDRRVYCLFLRDGDARLPNNSNAVVVAHSAPRRSTR